MNQTINKHYVARDRNNRNHIVIKCPVMEQEIRVVAEPDFCPGCGHKFEKGEKEL